MFSINVSKSIYEIFFRLIGFVFISVPLIKQYINIKNTIVNSTVPPANAIANNIPYLNLDPKNKINCIREDIDILPVPNLGEISFWRINKKINDRLLLLEVIEKENKMVS